MWVSEVGEGNAYWSWGAGGKARKARMCHLRGCQVSARMVCKCGDTASKHLQREEPRKGVDDSQREEENVAKRKEGE